MKSKDIPGRLDPWTLTQLYEELQSDLRQCQTESEKINCRAIAGREIREKAIEFSRQRKLTPMEEVIAKEFGF